MNALHLVRMVQSERFAWQHLHQGFALGPMLEMAHVERNVKNANARRGFAPLLLNRCIAQGMNELAIVGVACSAAANRGHMVV